MGELLQLKGDLDDAEAEYRKAIAGFREVCGERVQFTLWCTGNLADTLREKGELDAATAAMGDTVLYINEVLGPDHMVTLRIEAQAARLAQARTGDATYLRDVVRRMVASLGQEHQYTRKYVEVLDGL